MSILKYIISYHFAIEKSRHTLNGKTGVDSKIKPLSMIPQKWTYDKKHDFFCIFSQPLTIFSLISLFCMFVISFKNHSRIISKMSFKNNLPQLTFVLQKMYELIHRLCQINLISVPTIKFRLLRNAFLMLLLCVFKENFRQDLLHISDILQCFRHSIK